METYLIWSAEGLYSHSYTMQEAQKKISEAIYLLMKTMSVDYEFARRFGRFEVEKRYLEKNEIDYLEA